MRGLLLVNLGTPEAPTPKAVRTYLRQFLSDPRVIDMNRVGRWFLLELIILPRRPRRSAEAYRQVWDERGSPLLYHSEDLASAVAQRLGAHWHVELAMRYGQPSIASAISALAAAGVSEFVTLPLFPQLAESTTGSAIAAVNAGIAELESPVPVVFAEPFYDHPGFLEAFADVGRPMLAPVHGKAKPDHILFSFHGLPERHVRKADPSGEHCLVDDNCCAELTDANRHCYRAQCYATARRIAERLGLSETRYSVAFQSRLGRTPWIGPHTDATIEALAAAGIEHLAVFCPAFVADCLETLEEIGIRGREQFIAAGGKELTLIPSLNASPAWADAVADIARQLPQNPPTTNPASDS